MFRVASPIPYVPGLCVLLLVLGGCASEGRIVAETEPLRAQLARVEQSQASARAGTADMQRGLDALRASLETLRTHIDTIGAEVRSLAAQQATGLAARDAEQAALREQALRNELRLDELASLMHDADQTLAALGEQLTHTDLRVDEALTLARDALDAHPARE